MCFEDRVDGSALAVPRREDEGKKEGEGQTGELHGCEELYGGGMSG